MLRRLAAAGGGTGPPLKVDRGRALSSSLLGNGVSQQQADERRSRRGPVPPPRTYRMTPRYEEGGRVHKTVSFGEMAGLILKEKLTFGGALAAIGLASASSLVIPHIFGAFRPLHLCYFHHTRSHRHPLTMDPRLRRRHLGQHHALRA